MNYVLIGRSIHDKYVICCGALIDCIMEACVDEKQCLYVTVWDVEGVIGCDGLVMLLGLALTVIGVMH